MQTHLILNISSEDTPGVVEAVASAVADHDGNWLESSFSQLAGRFAGLAHIQIDTSQVGVLNSALSALSVKDIEINISKPSSDKPLIKTKTAHFHALGPDKPGIVREFTQTFSRANINIDKINSRITSMPYSGDPLFEADGSLSIPEKTDIDALEDALSKMADEIGIDFKLEEVS